ncbi:glycosyltransferase family 39 protein [Candidatus Gottesmanbacteria bacterium]|nr:glycosyltransferase family 39 protein [Candidatus Gottesmanbacteria bacterium]
MKKNWPKIILLFIFLLALFLRTYQLNDVPKGFYEEEVTNAYVGRFILQNGKDLYGHAWPLLYFDKFGDYPPILPLYLSGLSTYIFGFTEFAARFPVALVGALTVIPVYLLGLLLFEAPILGLMSALVVAISPWHVVLSRTTAEGVVAFFVFTIALYFILHRRLALSIGLFVLSYFLYPATRILVPLALLPLPLLVKSKTQKITLLLTAGFFFLLTAAIATTPWGKGRFLQTSLFHSTEVAERIKSNMTALNYGETNLTIAHLFNNKVVGYTREFLQQYASYFSPKYLFLEGGGQPRYYNVSGQGLLPVVFALLLLSGFLPFVMKGKMSFISYIIYLLIVSPLPSVLTVDFVPHVHRSMFMLLPLTYLIAYGFGKTRLLIKKDTILIIATIFVLLLETIYFWHQYAQHSASLQSILRNDGDKEMIGYVITKRSKYDKIIIPGFERLPIYYLYFTHNLNPNLIGKFRFGIQIDSVDNIIFANDWCPTKYFPATKLSPQTLLVNNGDCENTNGFREIKRTIRSDSTKAYKFLLPEVTSPEQ